MATDVIPGFEPRDPDFVRRITDEFNRQGAMATLGLSLESVEPGRVLIHLPMSPAVTQQNGYVHAGVSATALDSACGFAGISLIPPEAFLLTIEFKLNLFSPARGDLFIAEGRVLKPGRSVTVTEGRLYTPERGHDRPVATMTATLMTLYPV